MTNYSEIEKVKVYYLIKKKTLEKIKCDRSKTRGRDILKKK